MVSQEPPVGRFRGVQFGRLTFIANQEKQWVGYDRISANLKRAIIAAEDAKFVDHEGFDWEGIQHAIEKNQRKGRIVAGGSTISQQLAKNLFLTPAKTTWRKAEEAIVTLMLETIWSKQRIFEVYLNVIEWGDGVFRRRSRGPSLLRRDCRTADARAGRATCGNAPQPSLLRSQPQRTGSGQENDDHPRPHAVC
jgi:monofunctional biosynthetic peptidoglycan transglycosylase